MRQLPDKKKMKSVAATTRWIWLHFIVHQQKRIKEQSSSNLLEYFGELDSKHILKRVNIFYGIVRF